MTVAELCDIAEVNRVVLGPDDMIVVKVPYWLTDEEHAELGTRLRTAIPLPTKILVMENGADLSVLRVRP